MNVSNSCKSLARSKCCLIKCYFYLTHPLWIVTFFLCPFFMTNSWPQLPPKPRATLQKAEVRADCTASKGLMNNPLPSSASSFPSSSPGPHPSALFSISLILAQGLLMNKPTRKIAAWLFIFNGLSQDQKPLSVPHTESEFWAHQS